MNENIYKNLFMELEQYEHLGVSMKIDNNPASPLQIIAALMVKEEQSYMRDYIWDEKGHVKELSFHNIKING